MFHTNDQIVEIVKEYLLDEKDQQAILLNGHWGTGKTYFIDNILMPSLIKDKNIIEKYSIENDKLVKFKSEVKKYFGKNNCNEEIMVLKVSLYGINNTNEIFSAIWQSFVSLLCGNKTNKSLEFIYRTADMILKSKDIDLSQLPSLKKIKKLENMVIIFDDFERIVMDPVNALGFINNLIENKKFKAIIIANEKEIYVHRSGGDESREIYKLIKEKMIRDTITFKSDIKHSYDAIIAKYIDNSRTFEILDTDRDIVFDTFASLKCHNLRTLIFALKKFSKIDSIIETAIDDLSKESFKLEHRKNALRQCLMSSVLHKHPRRREKLEEFIKYKRDVFIKEIDDYVFDSVLNRSDIKSIICKKISEDFSRSNEEVEYNSVALTKLNNWVRLEDEDVLNAYDLLIEEVDNNRYSLYEIKSIVIRLMDIKRYGFDEINIDELVEKFTGNIKSSCNLYDLEVFEVFGHDEDFRQKYDMYMKPFYQKIIEISEIKKCNLLNSKIDNYEDFFNECKEKEQIHMANKGFMYYLNVDILTESLKSASADELFWFGNSLRIIYSFSNLDDVYSKDFENVKLLYNNMIEINNVETRKTRKVAQKSIISKLESVKEILESNKSEIAI